MKKQRENRFVSKFHLLNSENSEEIIWSCSDSSDYENCSLNKSYGGTKRNFKRKRKRSSSKKQAANLSNLDITFTDTKTNYDENLTNSHKKISECTSPILTQRHFKTYKSPVLKQSSKENKTSPVLPLKISPTVRPKVRKKLFEDNCSDKIRSPSPVLSIRHSEENRKRILNLRSNSCSLDKQTPKTDVALIQRVKSYFDSHFSSSQHSISECETSKSSSKSNDDIEITNSLTQTKLTTDKDQSMDCQKSNHIKTKKVKYKKDGLAFRLDVLLKKQTTSSSLWYHERFLAANSNFILPKEDYTAYRIEKVICKYGISLLDAYDVNNDRYLILLNNVYTKNNSIENDSVFKLYNPYRVLKFEKYNLIIGVLKYECKMLKKNE